MKFFVLKNPTATAGDAATDFFPIRGSPVGPAPKCAVCGKYLGMLPLLPPVRVELEVSGSRWGDIAFGPGDQILISAKLKELYLESGLVGLVRFDDVEVVAIKPHKAEIGGAPGYVLASIQRSRAVVQGAASELVHEEEVTCKECFIDGTIKRIKRVILQPGTWSGEDIFFARGLPGTIMVSERFKSLYERTDLANGDFIAAEKFSFDHYAQDGDGLRIEK